MDMINKTKAVKLQSHLSKYLVADDDRTTVRQSRKAAAAAHSIWLVEPSADGVARFKNCSTGLYLAASDVAFLLGMTGKRVVQSDPSEGDGVFVFDWQPIRDGFQIKLKTKGEGKFLRANGGTPPWRNSVTHDVPTTGATSNWTLWNVEVVDLSVEAAEWAGSNMLSSLNSSELWEDDSVSESFPASPLACRWSPRLSMNKSAMDYFSNAKVVRLRSHHGKYLAAHDDEQSVIQDRDGSSSNARWTVEFVHSDPPAPDDHPSLLRLKSCYGNYLTPSNHPFLLGMSGRKVLQSRPDHPNSAVEWEPFRAAGRRVKLRTRYGNFLRANGSLPPWRNSVTHDVPHRSSTQDWVLWDVEVVEFLERRGFDDHNKAPMEAPQVADSDFFSSDANSSSASDGVSSGSLVNSPPRSGGRVIYYHIAEEDGSVDDDDAGQGYPLAFKGSSIEELTRRLKEETGVQDIVVCTRSPLNGKLYPLRLKLPPNTVSLRVVVVPTASVGGV